MRLEKEAIKQDGKFYYKGCTIEKSYELYHDNGIETVVNDDADYFIGEWFKVVSGKGTKHYKHTHFRYDELGTMEGYVVHPVKEGDKVKGFEYIRLSNPYQYFSAEIVETLYNNTKLDYEPMYSFGYILISDKGKQIARAQEGIFLHFRKFVEYEEKYKKEIELVKEAIDDYLEFGGEERKNKVKEINKKAIEYREKMNDELTKRDGSREKMIQLIKAFHKEELLDKMGLK